jgi:hypothetical protein
MTIKKTVTDRVVQANRENGKKNKTGPRNTNETRFSPPKNLHFLAFQSKLLRQPDRLAVPGTKNPRCAHASTSNNQQIVQPCRLKPSRYLGFSPERGRGWLLRFTCAITSNLCNRN